MWYFYLYQLRFWFFLFIFLEGKSDFWLKKQQIWSRLTIMNYHLLPETDYLEYFFKNTRLFNGNIRLQFELISIL